MGFTTVYTKARKASAPVATNYFADIKPGVSITVKKGADGIPNTFKIGDMAEYDSYNLSYFGAILAITGKTVSIREKYGNKVHRLDLEKFCWRNHNFNLGEKIKENNTTSHYI